ncbi:VOC family protein [Nocardia sp. CC227C]|uniref:VOC family protein n=1 Tax=Nocardia sp. CC227C TaxID=3044562 RepID=UPI00278BAF75|nr:VOC family protein [Nocardia sp. CC227C]
MFGLPSWFDVTTPNPAKAIGFYIQMFDWTAEPAATSEFGKYILFRKDGRPVAGLVERSSATPQPDGWLTYLSTDDLDGTLAGVQSNGGRVQRPVGEVPGVGSLAVVTDPVNSSIGVIGSQLDAERAVGTGTPVWTEIETVDWPVTVEFMTKTFGLHTESQSDTPGSRFVTMHDQEQPRGGIFELGPDVSRSRWEVAFLVPDAQRAVDHAVDLGAGIVRPVYDVPVGTGLGARLSDPSGAHFNIIAF